MLDTNLTSRDVRAFQDCREEGRQAEAIIFVSRQLRRRFGPEVVEGLSDRLESLSLETLEDLGEALLDFSEPAADSQWLDAR